MLLNVSTVQTCNAHADSEEHQKPRNHAPEKGSERMEGFAEISKHQRVAHEAVKYHSCQCIYQATSKGHLFQFWDQCGLLVTSLSV